MLKMMCRYSDDTICFHCFSLFKYGCIVSISAYTCPSTCTNWLRGHLSRLRNRDSGPWLAAGLRT